MFRLFKKTKKKAEDDVTHEKVRRMTSTEKNIASRLMMLSSPSTAPPSKSDDEIMDIVTKTIVFVVREHGEEGTSYMLVKDRLIDEIGIDAFDNVKQRVRELIPMLVETHAKEKQQKKKDRFRSFDSENFDVPSKTDRAMEAHENASTRDAKTEDAQGLDQLIVHAREALMNGRISQTDFERIQRHATRQKSDTNVNTHFMLKVRNPPVYGGARTMELPCSYDPVTHKLGLVMNDRLVITKVTDWAEAQGFRVGQRIVLANGKNVKTPEEVYWAIEGHHLNAAPSRGRGYTDDAPPVLDDDVRRRSMIIYLRLTL